MLLRHLSLVNFRLYARLEIDFPEGIVVLRGANAQGKTSLLEAIYYLATGQAYHASSDRQLIHFLALHTEPLPFALIVAETEDARHERWRLECRLIQETPAPGEQRLRKEVLINGARKRRGDLVGRLTVVLFLPQDLRLVEGSPADRRRYLDLVLSQVDSEYATTLAEYNRALSQRNALLKLLQNGNSADIAQLDFWDELVCRQGAQILARRSTALAELETLATPIHRTLTGGADSLRLAYHPAFTVPAADESQLELPLSTPVGRLDLPAAEIEAALRRQLQRTRAEEISRGVTLVGPHRDEVRWLANGIDLGIYGSRGQARTAVLALKLAEVAWLRARLGEWPLLLLDEVLAELDGQRRQDLLTRLGDAAQCILTTSDVNLFPAEFINHATIWEVKEGQILGCS